MSGSLSSWFPQWLGGTAGAAGAQGYSDIAAAMNPALSAQASMASAAPSYSNQIASSINPNWTAPSGGGNAVGGDLASALKGVNQAAGKQDQQQGAKPPQMQTPQSSPMGRPSGQGLTALMQLLNQRTNMYMGQTNPQSAQPQSQTQRTNLLGI